MGRRTAALLPGPLLATLFALVLALVPLLVRASDDPVAALIRAHVEHMHDAGTTAFHPEGIELAEGVARFYEQRRFLPAWDDPARLDELLAALAGTAADGLDPQDYHLELLQRRRAAGARSPMEQAQTDLLATHAFLLALSHLHRGKVDPKRLDPDWQFETRSLGPPPRPSILEGVASGGDVAQLFNWARPQHPIYRRLRDALARLRAVEAAGGWPAVLPGSALHPGMTDTRVPVLRERLAAAGFPTPAAVPADLYDESLATAVRAYQIAQRLKDDAVVGRATLAALNVPVSARIDQLRVNMERARWLLHELEGDFVLVDIAGYRVAFFRDSKPVWTSRVQVGQPYRSTPVFKSEITYVTFNPTWTIPPTILRKDVLPKVREDAGYLAQRKIRVLDAIGQELDPATVDWWRPGAVTLRQDAGPGNALGRVAIRFPNPYRVYLHDTPHQSLFGSGARAFSSGCIRVENPLSLVELLLGETPGWNRQAIDHAIAEGKTRSVYLARPIPILLLYWTVDVTAEGLISFKPDIYERDAALLRALSASPP